MVQKKDANDLKMQVILDLKDGGPEMTSKQSDTYDVAAMVGEQIQTLTTATPSQMI